MDKGSRECSIPKDQFPQLLNILMKKIEGNQVDNIKAGFRKCGIIPLDREPVLKMLPPESNANDSLESEAEIVNDSLVSILKCMRYPSTEKKAPTKRQRMKIEPGQSVEVDNQEVSSDSEISVNEDDNINKSDNSSEDGILIGSDWNGSDEDEDEPEQPATNIKRNGKVLKGVFKITDVLKINDWIVGDFTNSTVSKQCSTKTILFIGTILETEKTKVKVSFIKYRPTKLDSGKMFVFPEHEDIYWIDKIDVVGTLKHPELKRRGLMKFEIDYNEW